MRYQSVAARFSLCAFVVALAISLIASFGTRLGFWNYETGFELLAPGVGIGLIAALTGVFWLASALRNNDSRGWRWGFSGLVGAVILLYVPLSVARRAYDAPPIHDISPDGTALPPNRDVVQAVEKWDGKGCLVVHMAPQPAGRVLNASGQTLHGIRVEMKS